MTESPYLGFDYPNVGYVLDGEEDATIRYGFDRDLHIGQLVRLETPGGTVFAIAEIADVWTGKVRQVLFDLKVVDGRSHPAQTTKDLCDRLNGHYPEASIGFDDEVTVIYFDVVEIGVPK